MTTPITELLAHTHGLTPNSPREYGSSKALLVFWDLSEHPTDNSDRVKKLGSADGTHGMAFCGFDKKTLAAELVDGNQGKPLTAFWLFEPDNWALRYHTKEGKESEDSVWALRLIADHDNRDFRRQHRSTMVINECREQEWAWVRDQWWVLKRRRPPPVDDEELKFDKAGFLKMICGEVPIPHGADVATKDIGSAQGPDVATGSRAETQRAGGDAGAGADPNRATLMLSLDKTGGYCTDSTTVAQLWHVLHLWNTGGGTTQRGVCPEPSDTELCLRGDVRFDVEGKRCSLAYGDGGATEGKILGGAHWINSPQERAPGTEHASDTNSNQTPIHRDPDRGIWVFVRQPREWVPPTFPPTVETVPATFPSIPAGYAIAASASQSAFVGRLFLTALVRGYWLGVDIPEDVPANWGINAAVDFLTPTAGLTADDITMQLDYCAVDLQADASPAALTGSLSKAIAVGTYAGSDTAERLMFFVPYTDIVAKRGGKLAVALYRRGDTDRSVRDLLVVGLGFSFGPEITRITAL